MNQLKLSLVTMRPWGFLEQTIKRGEAKYIAGYMGLSPQTITGWCREPNIQHKDATGRRSPYEHIQNMFLAFEEFDGNKDRCHVHASYVSAMAGGVHIAIPDVEHTESSISALMSSLHKEHGESTEAFRVAWWDGEAGKMTRKDKDRAIKELYETVEANMQAIAFLQGA